MEFELGKSQWIKIKKIRGANADLFEKRYKFP